jgi:hypothetical protein
MVVTLGLDIGVCHEEHGEDNEMTSHRGKIKLGGTRQILVGEATEAYKTRQYLKVSATEPIFSGAYHAEKATITGI